MSHFSNLKTHFKEFFHLENALKELNINYKKEKNQVEPEKNVFNEAYSRKMSPYNYDTYHILVTESKIKENLEQYPMVGFFLNRPIMSFKWNDTHYDLNFDPHYWNKSGYSETFFNKISQEYARQALIHEAYKVGFKPIQTKQNEEELNTISITLQRWNGSVSSF